MSRVLGVLLVFSLGVTTAWGIRYIKSSRSSQTSPPIVNTQATPAPAPQIAKKFAQPRFGTIAVVDCQSRCASLPSQNQEACQRACQRLHLRSYGRRVTLEPLNPEADADAIIKSCLQKEVRLEEHLVSSDWEEEAVKALQVIKKAVTKKAKFDLGTARLQLKKTLAISNTSKFPPGGTDAEIEFSESIVRTSCLFSHLSLGEMGILTARANSDEFSENYYIKLKRKLLNSARESESLLFSQAAAFPSFEGI